MDYLTGEWIPPGVRSLTGRDDDRGGWAADTSVPPKMRPKAWGEVTGPQETPVFKRGILRHRVLGSIEQLGSASTCSKP